MQGWHDLAAQGKHIHISVTNDVLINRGIICATWHTSNKDGALTSVRNHSHAMCMESAPACLISVTGITTATAKHPKVLNNANESTTK